MIFSPETSLSLITGNWPLCKGSNYFFFFLRLICICWFTDSKCTILPSTFDYTLYNQYTIKIENNFFTPKSYLMLLPSLSHSIPKRLINITYFYYHRLVLLVLEVIQHVLFHVEVWNNKVSWKLETFGKVFIATPILPALSCHTIPFPTCVF